MGPKISVGSAPLSQSTSPDDSFAAPIDATTIVRQLETSQLAASIQARLGRVLGVDLTQVLHRPSVHHADGVPGPEKHALLKRLCGALRWTSETESSDTAAAEQQWGQFIHTCAHPATYDAAGADGDSIEWAFANGLLRISAAPDFRINRTLDEYEAGLGVRIPELVELLLHQERMHRERLGRTISATDPFIIMIAGPGDARFLETLRQLPIIRDNYVAVYGFGDALYIDPCTLMEEAMTNDAYHGTPTHSEAVESLLHTAGFAADDIDLARINWPEAVRDLTDAMLARCTDDERATLERDPNALKVLLQKVGTMIPEDPASNITGSFRDIADHVHGSSYSTTALVRILGRLSDTQAQAFYALLFGNDFFAAERNLTRTALRSRKDPVVSPNGMFRARFEDMGTLGIDYDALAAVTWSDLVIDRRSFSHLDHEPGDRERLRYLLSTISRHATILTDCTDPSSWATHHYVRLDVLRHADGAPFAGTSTRLISSDVTARSVSGALLQPLHRAIPDVDIPLRTFFRIDTVPHIESGSPDYRRHQHYHTMLYDAMEDLMRDTGQPLTFAMKRRIGQFLGSASEPNRPSIHDRYARAVRHVCEQRPGTDEPLYDQFVAVAAVCVLLRDPQFREQFPTMSTDTLPSSTALDQLIKQVTASITN